MRGAAGTALNLGDCSTSARCRPGSSPWTSGGSCTASSGRQGDRDAADGGNVLSKRWWRQPILLERNWRLYRSGPGKRRAGSLSIARGNAEAISGAAAARNGKTAPEVIAPLDTPPHLIPQHVAIIMDGNGRWALRQGRSVQFGHEQGVGALRECVKCCRAWGIPALTVYAFSMENWGRRADEVTFLMGLVARVLRDNTAELASQGVRLHFIGDIRGLSPDMQREISRSEAATANCAGLHLSVAINYSGRNDLVRAMQGIAARVAAGELDPADVDESTVNDSLAALRSLPPTVPREPDLLIRTSGEQRLSNFMLWDAAYSELHFTDTLWPDFCQADLRAACHSFAQRQRRFGGRPGAK